MRLLIVCATEAEAAPVRRRLPGARVVVSGVGKVGAAAATVAALLEERPDAVLSVGVAGAYPGRGLAVGDVVVATRVRVADEGLETTARFVPFERPGMPVPGARALVPDPELRSLLVGAPASGFRVVSGPIATVSVCAGTDDLAGRRAAEGFLAEGMEGAAVAHVAERYGVPFAEVRGISNPCGDRDGAPFELDVPARHAAEVVAAALGGAS